STAGGSAVSPIRWTGANASGSIDGTRAVIQAATAGMTLISQGSNYHDWDYLDLNGGGLSGVTLFNDNASFSRLSNSLIHNVTNGPAGAVKMSGPSTLFNSQVYSTGSSGQAFNGATATIDGCYFHDNDLSILAGAGLRILNTVIANSTPGAGGVAAVYINGTNVLLDGVTIDGSNNHGDYVNSGFADLYNVLCTSVTNTAFNAAASNVYSVLRNCAGWNNGTNVSANLPRSSGFAALSADPYVSRAGANYALNPASAAFASL